MEVGAAEPACSGPASCFRRRAPLPLGRPQRGGPHSAGLSIQRQRSGGSFCPRTVPSLSNANNQAWRNWRALWWKVAQVPLLEDRFIPTEATEENLKHAKSVSKQEREWAGAPLNGLSPAPLLSPPFVVPGPCALPEDAVCKQEPRT